MKDKQISVQVYRKTKTGWQYWKTMEFSHFKYFVEKFITGLLERGYKYAKTNIYYQKNTGGGLCCDEFITLTNDRKKIKYRFETSTDKMRWLESYIVTWEISKNQEKKEPLDKT